MDRKHQTVTFKYVSVALKKTPRRKQAQLHFIHGSRNARVRKKATENVDRLALRRKESLAEKEKQTRKICLFIFLFRLTFSFSNIDLLGNT